MPNLADAEAHADWLRNRPDPDDRPDPADYAWPALGTTTLDQPCTCKADPINDPHHSCVIHPPF